jgi:hypothetical protein
MADINPEARLEIPPSHIGAHPLAVSLLVVTINAHFCLHLPPNFPRQV